MAFPLVRYSGPFLKWTKKERRQMDQRTRKLMTIHKALHSRDDIDRLYVSRKEGARGLTSIEVNLDASIRGLEDHIKMNKEGQITATNNIINNIRRCRWCNCYRRRKWTRRHQFKSWTRLIAFHIALIPLGKVWIQSLSLQLWVNSRAGWFLQPWWGN